MLGLLATCRKCTFNTIFSSENPGLVTKPRMVNEGFGYVCDGPIYYQRLSQMFSWIMLGIFSHLSVVLGRYAHPLYQSYHHKVLQIKSQGLSMETLKEVSKYCVDFPSYPCSFYCDRGQESFPYSSPKHSTVYCTMWLFPVLIARFLIYPGFTFCSKMDMLSYHFNQRNLLIGKGGIRAKIRSHGKDYIDCMYFEGDKKTLVVISNGNLQYYEDDPMIIARENGFPVLCWNHLGFNASTGCPTTEGERDAIIAVIEFATHFLRFRLQDIVLYGWSIGCYTSAYAAAIYPELKGVMLDAPFNHIGPLLKSTVNLDSCTSVLGRDFYNLDVAGFIAKYRGPLRVIIHRFDSIMCTNKTNADSNLALVLLKSYVSSFTKEHMSISGTSEKFTLSVESIPDISELSFNSKAFSQLRESSSPLLSCSNPRLHQLERAPAAKLDSKPSLSTSDTQLLYQLLARRWDVGHCIPLPSYALPNFIKDIEEGFFL